MAKLEMKAETTITVNSEEFRLITRGLRAVLKNEEIAPALALQEELMLQRGARAKSLMDGYQKAVNDIQEAHKEKA